MTDRKIERISAHVAAPTIETERLVLRGHTAADFDALVAIYRTERSRFMGGPMERNEVWTAFADSVGQWALLGCGTWAVDRRSDGRCVGEVGLNKPVRFPEPEVGWLLYDGFEGEGYATEAARAVLAFAVADCDLVSLVSYIDRDNHASVAVVTRLGAVHDSSAATPDDEPCLVMRHDLASLRSG